MNGPEAFFRDVESVAFWRRLAPWLHIEQKTRLEFNAQRVDPPQQEQTVSCSKAGYLEIPSFLDSGLTSALARAITALRSNELHPTFIYVYDETWHLLDALHGPLSRLLGDDFEVLADAWAWHIDPRIDRAGWPIHRGSYDDVRDPSGTPRLVNVWIALTNATERNACIHLVPLSRDPHYPHDLHNLAGLSQLARPLPAAAGSALVWNANAAHWGGTCDPSFDQPRISVSFTAHQRGGPNASTSNVILPLSFRSRLDLIADQFATYGLTELAPQCNEMRWAAITRGMKQAAARR
jgi:hypothetical protein